MPAPVGLLAELTHRCPLQCPYCSNPLAAGTRRRRAADRDLARRAGAGGRPRRAAAASVRRRADRAARPGGDRRAGRQGRALLQPDHGGRTARRASAWRSSPPPASTTCRSRSRTWRPPTPTASPTTRAATPRSWRSPAGCARSACRSPSTHRSIARTSPACPPSSTLAERLGAQRLEVAHVQYYGWALQNRRALMPTREQVLRSAELVEQARERLKGILVIDFVVPDYYASRPKPCMGGWGRGIINITPSGKVLPCHAAESIPGLAFDNVRDRRLRDIWLTSEAFQRFRGTRLDARAVPLLRIPRGRLGRLPLPGACLHRRRRACRSGLRQILLSRSVRAGRRAGVGCSTAGFHVPQSAPQRVEFRICRQVASDLSCDRWHQTMRAGHNINQSGRTPHATAHGFSRRVP